MERFASTAERIAREPAKLEKIALLADYFRELGDDDLVAAARFFSGDRSPRAIGARSHSADARSSRSRAASGASTTRRCCKTTASTGDLGAALGALVRPPSDAMLFRDR